MITFDHYAKLKKSFKNASILVIGDVVLDLYITGESNRISPEAPIPIVKIEKQTPILGGAANVAHNLSRLGATVFLSGAIGLDKEAKIFKEELQKANIKSSYLIASKRPTTTKTRILCNQQQMLRLDSETTSPLPPSLQNKMWSQIKAILSANKVQAVIVSDYAKGVITPTLLKNVITLAKKKKVPVIVDPKNNDFSLYKGATYIKPNLAEAAAAVNKPKLNGANEKEVEAAGKVLLRKANTKGILISRNKYGMSLIHKNNATHITAKATEVSDVSGAGDTVLAVFTLGLASNLSPEFSAELANVAAGIVVQKHGTATVTAEEIFKSLNIARQQKALPQEELKHFIEIERALGNKIVFTNGCFDLLHVGHVKLLEESRKQGDVLVVAINSDTSVQKLKGKGRPLINEEDRARLLLSLNCVNYVVIFKEETPRPLLRLLKPDVLVKGGDYKYHEVVGWEIVESYGGKIVTIDPVKGKSTTKTLRKILKQNIQITT